MEAEKSLSSLRFSALMSVAASVMPAEAIPSLRSYACCWQSTVKKKIFFSPLTSTSVDVWNSV